MLAVSKRELLAKRAALFAKARAFFAERDVLEVDTNILRKGAPIDAYIDVMEVDMGGSERGYLHTSPEYGLKKLLSEGSGDIYQLSHVFRAQEISPWHSPEFTMLEWYRLALTYQEFIEETLDLIRLFLKDLPHSILSYRQALLRYADFDYIKEEVKLDQLVTRFSEKAPSWDRDTKLSLLFSHLVEPNLGQQELTVITGYPASQAALAKTCFCEGIEEACRFEIYYKGIELANGYDELTESSLQRERFMEENNKRTELGKKALPLDEEFLACFSYFPGCCGVAVGMDRLVKLHLLEENFPISIPAQLETVFQL